MKDLKDDDMLFQEGMSGVPVYSKVEQKRSREQDRIKESHSVDILEGLIKSRKHLDLQEVESYLE